MMTLSSEVKFLVNKLKAADSKTKSAKIGRAGCGPEFYVNFGSSR